MSSKITLPATYRSIINNKIINKSRFNKPDFAASLLSTDLDLPAISKVCRACLVMNVKMYHILENQLRVMYERVTGFVINTEDKLPQMLCWECVARLSSANNFIEKASRSQSVVLNKINDDNFIKIRDIESVNRTQHRLKSSLGKKSYKVNYSDTHFIYESDENEQTNKELENSDDDIQLVEPKIKIDVDINGEPICVNAADIKQEMNEKGDECVIVEEEHVLDDNNMMPLVVYPTASWNLQNPIEIRVTYDNIGVNNADQSSSEKGKNANDNDDENPSGPYVKVPIYKRKSKSFNSKVNDPDYLKKLFICDICEKRFKRKGDLSQHITRHPRIRCCSYCNYTTNYKKDLDVHVNSVHTKQILFKCSYCNYETYRQPCLKIHQKKKHTFIQSLV